MHLASTLCASPDRTQPPSACQNSSRVTVQFDSFDLARNTIVADIGAVLRGANVNVHAPCTSPGFTDNIPPARLPFAERGFHNTSLYAQDGQSAYPAASPAIVEFTGYAFDKGKFRTPSLRNVAVTAPASPSAPAVSA